MEAVILPVPSREPGWVASFRPVSVFFPLCPRSRIAVVVYGNGYGVVELGEKATLLGWRAIRLPQEGAIARVREGHGWRERYFFAFADKYLVGEIAPDTVSLQKEISLGPGAVAIIGGGPGIRPGEKKPCWRHAEKVGVMSIIVAPSGLLDAVVRSDERSQFWHRARPDGGSEEWELPVWGPAEVAPGLAVVIQDGQAYAAGWGWNTAHLVAEEVKAAGLSPAGDRMVLLRREGGEWVWDFRRIRGTQVLSGPVVPALVPADCLGVDSQAVCRISPDLQWAVFAAPERVLVARVPDPARRGNPGGQVPNPRRILPAPTAWSAAGQDAPQAAPGPGTGGGRSSLSPRTGRGMEAVILDVPTREPARAIFFPRPDMAIVVYPYGWAEFSLGEPGKPASWRPRRIHDAGLVIREARGRFGRERFLFFDGGAWEIAPGGIRSAEWEWIGPGAVSWHRGPASPFRIEPDRVWIGLCIYKAREIVVGEDGDVETIDISERPPSTSRLPWPRLFPDGQFREGIFPISDFQLLEVGIGLAAAIRGGRAYAAGWGWNVAHLVAEGVWALGLSPAGDRMVLLRREEDGWVWDFRRRGRRPGLRPGRILPATAFREETRPDSGLWEYPRVRISPDLRWLVAAEWGRVMIAPIPPEADPDGSGTPWGFPGQDPGIPAKKEVGNGNL
jgi:hypothetical protein